MEQLRFNIRDLDDIVCEKCGEKFFESALMLKHVPALLSPTKAETMYPIEIYRCVNCKEILQRSIPKLLRDEKSEEKPKIIITPGQ